jgi:hypothetical protein
MPKTDLPYKTAGDLRPAGDQSPAIGDFKIMRAMSSFVFVIIFFKKDPHEDLKQVQKDTPHDPLQSALKIRLETKILMEL